MLQSGRCATNADPLLLLRQRKGARDVYDMFISCSIGYKDGRLIEASTRGDGLSGEND